MRKKNRKMRGIVLLCSLVAFIGCAWGAANLRAKYVLSVSLTGTVSFSPNLATDITLFEHSIARQGDGSYQLVTSASAVPVNQNTYNVMPGVDIPKDPYITITERTTVPGYLYVEVVDSTPDTITYSLTTDWQKMTGITGKNGGSVYAYVGSDLTVDPTTRTIKILSGDSLTVSDQYAGENFSLDFYAYLYQKLNTETTGQETFSRAFNE